MILTEAEALAILKDYAPDLDAEASGELLARKTETRTVAGQAVELRDPFGAALADLMRPDRVTARSQGSTSETYVDPFRVAAYLQAESDGLRASWPLGDDKAPEPINTDMELIGWRF